MRSWPLRARRPAPFNCTGKSPHTRRALWAEEQEMFALAPAPGGRAQKGRGALNVQPQETVEQSLSAMRKHTCIAPDH